jgi:hypothetical protein
MSDNQLCDPTIDQAIRNGLARMGISVSDDFSPTTNMSDAWQVFTSFDRVYKSLSESPRRSNGWTLGQPFEWQCTIYAKNTMHAETPQMAISLAALKAFHFWALIRKFDEVQDDE